MVTTEPGPGTGSSATPPGTLLSCGLHEPCRTRPVTAVCLPGHSALSLHTPTEKAEAALGSSGTKLTDPWASEGPAACAHPGVTSRHKDIRSASCVGKAWRKSSPTPGGQKADSSARVLPPPLTGCVTLGLFLWVYLTLFPHLGGVRLHTG